MTLNITLRQMAAFQALARHRNFTRVADELGLTQPAVSMQIKQLEGQLGVALIEQRGKRMDLTEEGEEVLAGTRAILQRLDDLESALNERKGVKTGRLRISVVTTVNAFAPVLLLIFQQRFPGISIVLDVANHKDLLVQLTDNDVDMVIMGRPPVSPDLVAGAFLENPLVVVAHPDHPLAVRRRLIPSALSDQTFIMREPGSGTRRAMERFFTEQDLSFISGMEVSGAEALKQSVQAGLGLGLMSRDAVRMELDAGLVVELEVKGLPIPRHWYLVHHQGKRLSPPARAFKDFILTEASDLLRDKRGQA
ncbi:MAG TPA: LysR family transcriptional regulator [Rhodospirillales bacterium]|nr:LysR family transcriptional regulator [Rhodospirillales bacterium]